MYFFLFSISETLIRHINNFCSLSTENKQTKSYSSYISTTEYNNLPQAFLFVGRMLWVGSIFLASFLHICSFHFLHFICKWFDGMFAANLEFCCYTAAFKTTRFWWKADTFGSPAWCPQWVFPLIHCHWFNNGEKVSQERGMYV